MNFWRCPLAVLAATLAGPAAAAPVTLSFSSTSSSVHDYFVGKPFWAQAQLVERSGSFSLDPDGTQASFVALGLSTGTGPADPGCCESETASLAFKLTVEGVTQAAQLLVRATEVGNDQYQFDVLESPALSFDLGSLGVLSISFMSFSGQQRANVPLYEGTYVPTSARLVGPVLTVPAPGTLALALAGLLWLPALRPAAPAARAAGRRD